MNIGFALWTAFDQYPSINKTLLLEEDLVVSMDILTYFQQLAPLLDRDDNIAFVSGFGQNSFPKTARNLSTVLRVDMYPQYGWMTSKTWAKRAFFHWVKEGVRNT